MFSEFDRLAMTRALGLAERGLETTQPNPRVGCVIAKGDRIIGEGFHERAGEPHAEVMALRSAKEPIAGATAYVTLEPCSHHGRTPPCVNALIEARIARVVFAVQDPNPRVSGQGADALLRAGITVEAGLMQNEATELNIGFMKCMKEGLPWVRVKLAMSLDGRTALANGASQWITGEAARADVHRWRARCSAVMTGVGTVLADDPQLNVRLPEFKGRQPLRVVLDARLRSPVGAKVFARTSAVGGAGASQVSVVASGEVVVFVAAEGGDPAVTGTARSAAVGTVGAAPAFAEPGAADKGSANGIAPPVLAAAGSVAGVAPTADDATWAGAALSGAIPVRPSTPTDGATAPQGGAAGPAPPTGVASAPPTAEGSARLPGAAWAPSAGAAESDFPADFQARRAALSAKGVRIEEVPSNEGFLDLFAVLKKLGEMEVNEVLVEAGPTLAGQLLTTFFVDELLLYVAPKLLGPQGRPLVNLPELQSLQDAWGFSLFDAKRFGDDLRLRMRPK
jgi:diaminohydroxyphosphoribosylaminopyrimidine deaminase / 5-amino-6-(5-phosphoribosylamino)uracil reductase